MHRKFFHGNGVFLKHLFQLFLVGSLLFQQVSAIAQSSSWQKMMLDTNVNFYDVQQAFNDFWAGKDIVKGKGYMAFKRWENFMEPRCFPTGERMKPNAVQSALELIPKSLMQTPALWTYEGNTSVPHGDGAGSGRINQVRNAPGNPGTWYACAPAGGLWKTVDAGDTWTVVNTDFLSAIGVSDVAIDPEDPDILYIATGDHEAGNTYSIGILKSEDGGTSWQSTGLSYAIQQSYYGSRILIDPENSQRLFAATSAGLYYSEDAAENWTQLMTGEFRDVQRAHGIENIFFAVGNDDEFYRSNDNGLTWSLVSTGLPTSNVNRMAFCTSPADSNVVYIIACDLVYGLEGIYRSTDKGQSFTQQSDAFPNVLDWSTVGDDPGGQGWYDLAIACDPFNSNKVYTGGINIWSSSDGGITFSCATDWHNTPFLPFIHADIHSIQFIEGTSTILVGSDGGVSTFDGIEAIDKSGNLQIAQVHRFGISQYNPGETLSGWQDNGVNHTYGGMFNHVVDSDGMECIIHPTQPNIMYASKQSGMIFRTFSGPENLTMFVNSNSTGVNEAGSFVTPFVIGSNPSHLYIGKSKVYKSTNLGQDFTALAGFGSGPIRSLAVAPSDNNYIYASKNNSLYKCTNGFNFSFVSGLPNMYISDIAVDASNPLKIYLTFSGYNSLYKVYYSTNGGSSWTNLSSGLPNIPVNCITTLNGINGAIYIGTDVGVYYRDDSTGGWIPFSDQLPNTIVTDIEIQYPTSRVYCSTHGRGIWSSPVYAFPDVDAGLSEILDPNSVICNDTIVPKIKLFNSGSLPLTNVELIYSASGGTTDTTLWVGNLPSFDTTLVELNAYVFPSGTNNFQVTIGQVNGFVNDDFSQNNSLIISVAMNAEPGEYLPVTIFYETLCSAELIDISIYDFQDSLVFIQEGLPIYSSVELHTCLKDNCYSLVVEGIFPATQCDSQGGSLFDELNQITIGTISPWVSTFNDMQFCIGNYIAGCTNPVALNYNPDAQFENGTCTFPDDHMILYLDPDYWPDEIAWEIADSNGTVLYSTDFGDITDDPYTIYNVYLPDGCYTLTMYDSFGDGLYSEVSDCYIFDQDGNVYVEVGEYTNIAVYPFCTNSPLCSNCSDIEGCTNVHACNYFQFASIDNGTCSFGIPNDECVEAIPIVPNGVPNPSSNIMACIYENPNVVCPALNPVWFKFLYTGGTVAITIEAGTLISPNFGIIAHCSNGPHITCNDLNGVLLNTINLQCDDLIPGTVYYIYVGGEFETTGTFSISILQNLTGCTNPSASNFEPCAINDNGSCLITGCMDVHSCNFDPIATISAPDTCIPGSCAQTNACNFDPAANCHIQELCDYSCINCPGDLDSNGTVNTSDLILFVTSYGCNSECGDADLSGNDDVSIADLILLLAAFGNVCY